MKVEITKEQYDKLRGTGIQVDIEARYFIVDTKPKLKSKRTNPRKIRSPLQHVEVNRDGKMRALTATQTKAYHSAAAILGTTTMAGGELGEKLSMELKCSRDMGRYWVSALIETGALKLYPHA